MKRFFYTVMVVLSAFFLVNAGVKEKEALAIIPDRKM